MSDTDRVFALIAVAVVLTITVGLWLTNLLWYENSANSRAAALGSAAATLGWELSNAQQLRQLWRYSPRSFAP